jgi:hypothetical protein
MLPNLFFYRNVCLSLIVQICILAIHSHFIGCLPLEKSIINELIINVFIFNGKTHFTTYSVAYNYSKRL